MSPALLLAVSCALGGAPFKVQDAGVLEGDPGRAETWLAASLVHQRAGRTREAIDAAHRAVPAAIAQDGWPNNKWVMDPPLLHQTLRHLYALGEDLAIPPPGTCGEVRGPSSCPRSFLACTHAVAGSGAEGDSMSYGRLEVNFAHWPKESQLLDDDGKSPTWGLPVHVFRPWQCAWSQQGFRTLDDGDHATLVLESKVERACEKDECPPLLSAVCNLVEADPCLGLVATVCKLEVPGTPATFVVRDAHVWATQPP